MSDVFEEEKVPLSQRKHGNKENLQAEMPGHASELSSTSGAPDKYYKKFDFFYKRTSFRLMAEFYKHLFTPFQKLWSDKKKKITMIELLQSFAKQHFELLNGKLSQPSM
jgi:hypothetical protein